MSHLEDHPVSLAEPEEPATPGEALRRAREKAGWTLGRLARALNISVGTLSDIERNRGWMLTPDSLRLVVMMLETGDEPADAVDEAHDLVPELAKSRPEDHPAFWPTYQAVLVRCLDAVERQMVAEDRARESWPPFEDDPSPRRDERSAVARAAERASAIATEAVAALVARDEERGS